MCIGQDPAVKDSELLEHQRPGAQLSVMLLTISMDI